MEHKYLKNVATLELTEEKCIGCGRCLEVCPHSVFASKGTTVEIAVINRCMECGACAINCPAKAIKVSKGVGCAYAVIRGWITGGEISCDCSDDSSAGGCC